MQMSNLIWTATGIYVGFEKMISLIQTVYAFMQYMMMSYALKYVNRLTIQLNCKGVNLSMIHL